MQIELEKLLKTFGLPVGLAVVIAAVFGFLGVPIEQAFQLFGVLVGVPFVISFIINILKLLKVVDDGTAGKWSAALNLISIIALAIAMRFYPSFDFPALDAYIYEIGKALAVIVMFILQMIGTQSAHRFYVQGLGIKRFSYSTGA
jgi:hypothetical protein